MRLRIAVVGIGVAGSVVAARLAARDDVELTLIERVDTAEQADSGTGLNIGPNGVAALDRLDARLAEAVRSVSLPWCEWGIGLADGTRLAHFDLQSIAGCAGVRVRWAALYGVLRGWVAARTRFSTEVHSARLDAEGRIELLAGAAPADPWIGPYDMVIAGDGRYSQLRERLVGPVVPQHMGVALARLLWPDDSAGLIDDYIQWYCGHHRLFGYRVPGAALYLTASFPFEPGSPVPEAFKDPAVFRRAITPPGPVAPGAAYLIDRLSENVARLHWARNQQAPVAYRDPGGRLLVLGDAAHPMVPTLGQGATQALEDGVAAAAGIEALLDAGSPDVPTLTRVLERLRRGRVAEAMALSWQASEPMLLGAEPVAAHRFIRSEAFRARLREMYTGHVRPDAVRAAVQQALN